MHNHENSIFKGDDGESKFAQQRREPMVGANRSGGLAEVHS